MISPGALIRLLCATALTCGAMSSYAQTSSSPILNAPGYNLPTRSGANSFSGSVPTKLIPGHMSLSLQNAIDLGLKHNLGLLLSRADTRAARGQRWQELSALLPQVIAGPYMATSKVNIDELGFSDSRRCSTSLHR